MTSLDSTKKTEALPRCNLALTSPKPHRCGRAWTPVAWRALAMTSGSTPAAAKTTCGRLNGDQLDMNKDIQETPKEQRDSETTEHIARAAVRRQPPASQHIAEEDPTA